MRLLQRHMQRHVVIEFERDDFLDALRRIKFCQATIVGDAVLQMHHKVAFDEVGEIEQLVDLGALGNRTNIDGWPSLAFATENFGFSDHDQTLGAGTGFPPDGGCLLAKGDAETFVQGAAEKFRLNALDQCLVG